MSTEAPDRPSTGIDEHTPGSPEIDPQGDHEYVVRLRDGAETVECWVRVTPGVLTQLGVDEREEERVVRRTIAFLGRYQDVVDFPAIVELEDVIACYDGYAEAMRG